MFKAPKTTDGANANGPASLFGSKLPQTSTKFAAGRGGAGNIHSASDRTAFSFDEELQRQATRESKAKQGGAAYHVGRGGAGNWSSSRSPSSTSSRKDSSSSSGSTRSGFFSRISNTFDRS
jgi:hypothetical protein